MEKQEAATFMFTIANEIKRSFETPVIFLTGKDYADDIYNLLVEMTKAILDEASRERIAEIVVSFHRDWLQAVRELRSFKKKINTVTNDQICSSIEYTIECIKQRSPYFQQYIKSVQKSLSDEEHNQILADVEIIDDMHDCISDFLKDKLKCFKIKSDQTEFVVKVEHEIEELMNWIDRLNDNLAIQFCQVINLDPDLITSLTNTSKIMMNETPEKSASTSFNISIHDVEMRKLIEKIAILTERIHRLQDGSSAAVVALQHKKLYLVERLKALENLATKQKDLENRDSLTSAISVKNAKEDASIENIHMFNHRLPSAERFQLVEGLVSLWKVAIHQSGKIQSTISILSCVNSAKEVYSDNLGKFVLDKYGRKIYQMPDDDRLFQANESGFLVPVEDDEHHVYFYDDCGRYYLEEEGTRRIYKAHADASEYVIEGTGVMLKYKEIVDGVEYCYNNIGRYYINKEGKRIYRNSNSNSEYKDDGFGNLVQIRKEEFLNYDCPSEPLTTKTSNYLKTTIGKALKECLADVVLRQPADPILYLADALEQYRKNMELRERLKSDEIEMMELRKQMKEDEEQKAPATIKTPSSSATEADSYDSNFKYYDTLMNEL